MRDLSKIFRQAWQMAREGADRFGGAARDYFAESLRQAHKANRRNATAKDLIKIMFRRWLTSTQICQEVAERFIEISPKNMANRIWNMNRSPYVKVEKRTCPESGRVLYSVTRADKGFFHPGAITRALKSKPKVYVKKPVVIKRLPMSPQEINACRLANAFHQALRTRVFISPQLIEVTK